MQQQEQRGSSRLISTAVLRLVALSFVLLSSASNAQLVMSDTCSYKLMPLYVGGSSDEHVNCIKYDPNSGLIIVAGNTTSDDFAPAANDHGFIFALDTSGNWQWGKFFYNVSYAFSNVAGCRFSSDSSSLTFQGMGNSQPVVMDLNPLDGAINLYLSMEYYATSTTVVPVYQAFGAVYLDQKDYFDSNSYVYQAFTMNSKIQLLRVLKNAAPVVDWSYEFYDYTTTEQASDIWRRKDPKFITIDPTNPQVFYLSGRYQGYASVMQFTKTQGTMQWWTSFTNLTYIQTIIEVPGNSYFYGCGDYDVNNAFGTAIQTTQYQAGIFKMDNDGSVQWLMIAAGTNPKSSTTINNQDRCFGLVLDNVKTGTVTALLQIKMKEVRKSQYSPGDYYDTLLMQFDPNGNILYAVQITNGNLAYSMYSSMQGIVYAKNNYYFAGWAYGFQTNLQTLKKKAGATDYDAYVYKYMFNHAQSYDCIFENVVSSSTMSGQVTYYANSKLTATNMVTTTGNDAALVRTRTQNYLIPYSSKFSGGFPLLGSYKIPRPCAYKSYNMTQMNYYRGMDSTQYNIAQQNSQAFIVTMMDGNSQLLYQDGTNTSSIAYYNQTNYSIYVQADDENSVGVQKVVVRDCDSLNRLLELNLYINVLENTHPDFVSEVQTSWTLNVGDVVTYTLPQVSDPQNNDTPYVYIGYMQLQESSYPPFLMYANDSQTITLRPVSNFTSGQTYYFTIVVGEVRSKSVFYPYYCTIKMNGPIIVPNLTINWTNITYQIQNIDMYSKGQVKFSSPVNMTWLSQNFYSFFNVYWHDTNYMNTYKNNTLLDLEVDDWGSQDNQTVNFTMTFAEPYMIGLLVQISDTLFIDVNTNINYTGLFFGNISTVQLVMNTTQAPLTMIFDYRNNFMSTMRSTAVIMYWVLIGLFGAQFVLLIWRGVGLQPLWVMLEYLQLVSYMPIYNFRLIPYLYDAYKPALVSHIIIFNNTPIYSGLDDEFFNLNYKYYWLSTGRLMQSFAFYVVILIIILVSNIFVFVISKVNAGPLGFRNWTKSAMVQFKFNVYIRFYMMVYFDLTFFAVMKIIQGSNTTTARKAALLVSYVIFVINIVLPVFLITIVFRRFEILKIKEAKQSFNTLLLKLDKQAKIRVGNAAYFFIRRIVTAVLLTMPITSTFIFLQYVFVLMTSHAYVLYMVAVKPFKTSSINAYVLANETFYSALIIAIFIFSDATPEMNIKVGAAMAIIASLALIVIANVITNVVQLIRGPLKLKEDARVQKMKRAEKEALQKAEEEERRLKKKKEEEEFIKLPDDSQNNMSQIDNSTSNAHTLSEMNVATKSSTLKKDKKGKGKKTDDNVVESGMGQNTVPDSTTVDNMPATKKRRRTNKEKGNRDDVTEGTIGEAPSKKSKKRKVDDDNVEDTTTQNKTDFGTNPTQKDFL